MLSFLFTILMVFLYLDGFRAFVLCESGSGYVLRWFLDRSQELVKLF